MSSSTLRDQLLHSNHPEDVRGFLTQVWESTPTLPLQSRSERLSYFFQRGIETLLALPASNFFATLTVAFSLALISGFILLISNMDRTLRDLGSSLTITAYLTDETTPEQLEGLKRSIDEIEGVRRIEYTSKGHALSNLKQALGEKGALLGNIQEENPLPASIDIQLSQQSKVLHSTVVEALEEAKIVEEVISGNDAVEKIGGIMSAVKVLGYGGGLFILGVVLFLILNTIKLVIYSQRQEIEIMQLVGATEATVRAPFLVAGAIQGLFGAILGVLFLRILFGIIRGSLEGTALFGATLPLPQFFPLGGVFLILLIGTILGVFASALAVGRHLDV